MKCYAKNTALLNNAVNILRVEQPCTLRQLYYRQVSCGDLEPKQAEYAKIGRLMTRAREEGIVPRRWIVDHVRATLKPSSWSGLTDFADTVRNAYRKDFWASLDHHVEIFVEKDAIAGTIQPVTAEHDVALRVCRGYASVSFAGEIADEWREIQKPIFAYYLGDFDPSGFDIERDLREKLERYSGRSIYVDAEDPGRRGISWSRLGVVAADFAKHDLIRLPIKDGDNRSRGFREVHGDAGAEVDAIPPSELRRRVSEAINRHIDVDRWNSLLHVEELERETMRQSLSALGKTESSFDLDREVSE
jgi:hypothetical protein